MIANTLSMLLDYRQFDCMIIAVFLAFVFVWMYNKDACVLT